MDISYKDFKNDCEKIIEPCLKHYSYYYDVNKSEEFINRYY